MMHLLRANIRIYIIFTFAVSLFLSISTVANAYETPAKQAILFDVNTGSVLFEKAADEPMTPSSMSKLMTLYMLFDKLDKGVYTLETTFNVSEKAWKKGGSKMFVGLNSNVSVEDLIRGIIIQSGNDACIVVAEGIAGSEEAFAKQMNVKAKELGLTASHFVNATGWPDEGHIMSPRDLVTLSEHLIQDFPQFYPYFKEKNLHPIVTSRKITVTNYCIRTRAMTVLKQGIRKRGAMVWFPHHMTRIPSAV